MGSRRRPGLALAACIVVAAAALAVGAMHRSGPRTPAQRAVAIDAGVRCPSCEGLSVADSSSSTAVAIRTTVLARVRAGQSDAEVEQYLVSRYGQSILLRPPTSGLAGMVWVLPALGIVGAMAGLVVVLWRRRDGGEVALSDDDRSLVNRALAEEADDVAGVGQGGAR